MAKSQWPKLSPRNFHTEYFKSNSSLWLIILPIESRESLAEKVAHSLNAHELIKVKFNEFKDEKFDLAKELSDTCDANLIRVIGNVAILYKQAEKPEDRKYLD